MTSYTSTRTISNDHPRSGKLHKRNSSGNSLPSSPAPLSSSRSQFSTPYATFEEPFPSYSTTPPTTSTSSTPKIKPYLRKLSSAKDIQPGLDLSKSTVEQSPTLEGLGIADFGNRSVSDISFNQTRRNPHMRTTSTGSQMSTSSAGNKPFVHPMRQTPSYTPPPHSYASSTADDPEEARESTDVFTADDFHAGTPGFTRTRRSISISSTPQNNPTPLSQSHTAAELGLLAPSQTNLSLRSARPSQQRGYSDREVPTTTRSSMDRAFSLMSRRSDTEAASMTYDERRDVLRRKFEEKEASKRRKYDEAEMRRAEKQRRKSEGESSRGKNGRREVVRAMQEKDGRREGRRKEEVGGWSRFVRAFGCGR